MIEIGNDTMNWVEEMVCGCVNLAFGYAGDGDAVLGCAVTTDDLYDGVTNIPFARAVARNFVVDVLHNRYGFSYSVIAQRSEMTRESVMRCARKCHTLCGCDKSYIKVMEKINDRLRERYGEED